MVGLWQVPGSAAELFVVGGSPLLRTSEHVFEAMLVGWRDQRLGRNLHRDTVEGRSTAVRRFAHFTND